MKNVIFVMKNVILSRKYELFLFEIWFFLFLQLDFNVKM